MGFCYDCIRVECSPYQPSINSFVDDASLSTLILVRIEVRVATRKMQQAVPFVIHVNI